jgi:hypothetical protein
LTFRRSQEICMSEIVVPGHVGIDFREVIEPTRGWIVGVAESRSRVELLAFKEPPPGDGWPKGAAPASVAPGRARVVSDPRAAGLSAAELTGCTCPDFCERDHENE